MRLTEEQTAVVHAVEPRFTVRAAAGSGKTSVLVRRYMEHILGDGLRPDQVLAITFTRKAAAEMKKRVVANLRREGREEDARLAETGPIQTIHALCERLLRENSLHAGVDPEFEVIEGPELDRLFETALREAIESAGAESDEAGEYLREVAGASDHGLRPSVHGALRRIVQAVLGPLRSSGVGLEELRRDYADAKATLASWARGVGASLPGEAVEAARPFDEGWPNRAIDAMRSMQARPPAWLRPIDSGAYARAATLTAGLVAIAAEAWERLEGEMMRRQAFDFALLERLAVGLVEGQAAVQARLRRQYGAMLIDEAQDVNPMQYRLLDALRLERETMVGDPQQSIYGFRSADPELFEARTALGPCFKLSVNHRSRPGILAFVDRVFAQEWGERYSRMAPAAPAGIDDPFALGEAAIQGVELWPMQAKDSAELARRIAGLVDEVGDPREVAVLTRGNELQSQLGRLLLRLGIAVRRTGGSERFYARMEVRDVANALAVLCDPYDDYRMLCLLRSPFVGLSLDAVVTLAAQGRVYESLPGFRPVLPEDEGRVEAFLQWFDRLAARADEVPAWETVGPLLYGTPYVETVAGTPSGVQTIANLRKLLEIAVAQPTTLAREFAEQLHEIRMLDHREGDANAVDDDAPAVTLSTVHSAKGLEWPVVVVAETLEDLRRRRPSDVAVDARRGLLALPSKECASPVASMIGADSQRKQLDEELRLLYVALTRAKERLCVVVPMEAGDRSLGGRVARAVGFPDRTLAGVAVRELDPRGLAGAGPRAEGSRR